MSYIKERVKSLINSYLSPGSVAFGYYSVHCEMVTMKALEIASLNKDKHLDLDIIYQSAMLHDIGICQVHAPAIGCFGKFPYIAHGYLGREILEKEGFTHIAPVCERHIGMGISKEEIIRLKMELPHRDMIPLSNEEKLVCLADKFYSKSSDKLEHEKSQESIRKGLLKYGPSKVEKFDELLKYFRVEKGWVL
ncbi:MAG: HD domain-containing protein [Bacteroidetes bacterium]|nr:HD domain-containing protein [Bacteroidota bacterium]MBL6963497.1 HD domain-containing protein [Bacteroidota bacterium]